MHGCVRIAASRTSIETNNLLQMLRGKSMLHPCRKEHGSTYSTQGVRTLTHQPIHSSTVDEILRDIPLGSDHSRVAATETLYWYLRAPSARIIRRAVCGEPIPYRSHTRPLLDDTWRRIRIPYFAILSISLRRLPLCGVTSEVKLSHRIVGRIAGTPFALEGYVLPTR